MLMPTLFRNDLFDDFFDDFDRTTKNLFKVAPRTDIMRTDVKETKDAFELDIDLPGLKKSDVQIMLKEGYLSVNAAYKEELPEGTSFLRRERYYGTCSRSFYVGEDVEEKDIKAKFEDGVLKLSIAKVEPQPKVENNKFIEIEG